MGCSDDSVNLQHRRDGDLELRFLRFAQHPIHRVATYFFGMVHAQTGEELGKINLRVSSIPYIERYDFRLMRHIAVTGMRLDRLPSSCRLPRN